MSWHKSDSNRWPTRVVFAFIAAWCPPGTTGVCLSRYPYMSHSSFLMDRLWIMGYLPGRCFLLLFTRTVNSRHLLVWTSHNVPSVGYLYGVLSWTWWPVVFLYPLAPSDNTSVGDKWVSAYTGTLYGRVLIYWYLPVRKLTIDYQLSEFLYMISGVIVDLRFWRPLKMSTYLRRQFSFVWKQICRDSIYWEDKGRPQTIETPEYFLEQKGLFHYSKLNT